MSNEVYTAISVTLFILLLLKVICDGWTKQRSIITDKPRRIKKLIDDCTSKVDCQSVKPEQDLYVLVFDTGNIYLTARVNDTFNVLGYIHTSDKAAFNSFGHFTKEVLENSNLLGITHATEDDVALAALNKL